ncbi:MAG: FHA domain-containing protein [Saprospiraceae bacterium]|nr:FHA domain-containing protein [Saprospiraceae bacterium]
MNLVRSYPAWLLLLLFGAGSLPRLLAQTALGQPVFEIQAIHPDKRLGVLAISVNTNIDIREKDIVGIEKIGLGSIHALKYEKIDPRYRTKFDKSGDKTEDIAVLFLVDASTGMHPYLANIRTGIQTALQDGHHCSFFVSSYTDDLDALRPLPLRKADTLLRQTVQEISSSSSHLPNALSSVLIDFDTLPQAKKVIIVLSNQAARDEVLRKGYERALDKVAEDLAQSTASYLVFGIGIGAGADLGLLQRLAGATPSPADTALSLPAFTGSDTLSSTLSSILKNGIPRLKTLYFKPEKYIYVGEKRALSLSYRQRAVELSATQSYAAGSFIAPLFLGANTKSLLFWLGLFMVGCIVVFAIFVLLSLFVPYLNRLEFRRKYVVPYIRKGNKTETDPVTGDPILEGDLVVDKCAQLIPLNIWEALGRCPNHPECISSMGCSGAGAKEPTQGNFFSQKGVLKKLNWLFFGALGGFIAWTAYAIYQFTDMSSYQALVNPFFSFMQKDIPEGKLAELQITGFIDLSIGAILSATLAYVEEVGMSRKFSLLRILGKFLLGILLSFGTLLLGAQLQLSIDNYFISGLLTWLLFGITFGLILSIGSGIQFSRAFLGGALASILAFLFYFLGVLAIQNLYTGTGSVLQYLVDFIKMTSFIALGGILGYGIVTIVSRLEDFELEYLAPEQVAGMSAPISKWLKASIDVAIGTSSKCYVYIKWDDPAVADMHAIITYANQQVYIEPLAETLVNRVILPLNRKTPLQANDLIQLGRESTTLFRFIAKNAPPAAEQGVRIRQNDPEGKGKPDNIRFGKS